MHAAVREPLVGRAAQQSDLGRMVAEAARGRGNVCWLRGEPGIGKTALIDAALAQAAERGCRVLRGAARPATAATPLRLMADCLEVSGVSADSGGMQIARLLRGDAGGWDRAGLVPAASDSAVDLLERMCARQPVVLAADDLQWADEPSLLVWHRLARAASALPLLLIGSARPVLPPGKLDRLHELTAQRGGLVLELGPLDPADAGILAGRIAGGAPGPRLSAAVARAGGNPRYLTELVRALVADGLVEVTRGQAELRAGVGPVPASLTAAIEDRVAYLPSDLRVALRTAAFLGEEFSAGDWAAAAGRSAVELAENVAAAAADGVLGGAGDRLRFRHPVVREVLAGQVRPADRPELHSEIARRLARAGRAVDAVAGQLRAVPGPAADWLVSWLADLPEPALASSPRMSAELLERALDTVGPDDGRWEALADRLTRVLYWLGRDGRAMELASAVAARTSDHVLAARMRVWIIRSAARAGRPEQAAAARAGQPGDGRLPAQWRARLAAWSALLQHMVGRPAEGAILARKAMVAAEESGDPLAIACARYTLAMCGPAAARPALLDAALADLPARDPEAADLRMIVLASQIAQASELAQPGKVDAALEEGMLLAGRPGAARAHAILAAGADLGYRHGRWDDALALLARAGEDLHDADQADPLRAIAALIALRRGDRAAADAQLPPPAARPARPRYLLTQALAVRAEADGDVALAAELMSGWLAAPAGLGPCDRHADLPYLVYLALAAGDTGTARAAAAASQADAADGGSPGRVAAARCCRALVDNDAGALLAVADDYGRYGWLPMQAFALEEAAVRFGAAGEVTRARSALTGAARIYAGLGAACDLRRADTRLKGYGVRRGPNSIRRGPASGWESLTPSEQRVAQLVSQGLANADIAAQLVLSRRTVQTHVSRILAKLGLGSRVELVRAAARRNWTSG